MAATAYPKVTAKAWTTLRARATAAPSTKFTPAAVAALMEMSSPNSALDNTVRPMRRLGLIDEDGALTARGNKWRVNSSFDDACQEILDEIYPEELGALVGEDGRPDAAKVKTWFDHKGYGESNARQMAATYVMVASKQIPESPATDSGKVKKKASPAKKPAAKSPESKEIEKPDEVVAPEPPTPPGNSQSGPTVHLDIQIHIPADATPEQIDQIFSSMARHLYAR